MDNIYTEAQLLRLPWLNQPSIRARIHETTKKQAAAEQKAAQIQSIVNDISADPPILNAQLRKRRAALIKALNLTDAAIIASQEKVMIDLEKAALDTQKTAANDKKVAVYDDLCTFLSTILTALDVAPRPGQPGWIIPFPGQEAGVGVPIMTPKLVLDAGLKVGIERHRYAFTAAQIKHREQAAAKAAKRAAQKEKDDAAVAFTNASFTTAVTAIARRLTGRRPPASRRPQPRERQRRNPTNVGAAPHAQSRQRTQTAHRRNDTVARPPRRPRSNAPTGNGRGRRGMAPRDGRPPRARSAPRPRPRSPYPLRPTAARAALAARNDARRA